MTTNTAATLDSLRRLPLFAHLTDHDSACVEGGQTLRFAAGEIIVREGEPAEHFFVVLEGNVSASKNFGEQEAVITEHHPGGFFGEIPMLLNTPYFITARARCESRLFQLPKKTFWNLISTCPSVATQIVRSVAARLRTLLAFSQHRDKLASLGRMAAGLAHELNNPAAAAHRAAAQLDEAVEKLETVTQPLHQCLSSEQWQRLTALASNSVRPTGAADPVDQTDREERIATLLESRGLRDAWQVAPTLAAAGWEPPALDELIADMPALAAGNVFRWLEARLSIDSLLDEGDDSISRIEEVVKALRSYSRPEHAKLEEIDLHEGIEKAITMLSHKLKGVTLFREFDPRLPRIPAYASELNQVWSHLIDNALDAVASAGRVWVRTRQEGDLVTVEIADDGPGVPPENQALIFEPFFTTKGVGEGSGLGLVVSSRIVEQHGGEIELESRPGDTRFIVHLPSRSKTTDFEMTSALPNLEMESFASPRDHDAGLSFTSICDLPIFSGATEETRAWLEYGDELRLHAGNALIREGDIPEYFFVVLEGRLRLTKNYGSQQIVLATYTPGMTLGEKELVMDRPHFVDVQTLSECRLFRLTREAFWGVLRTSPAVTAEIMRVLATRVRNFEEWSQQREKLVQLGTMAAGLAHELNNPTSAARRSVSELRAVVEQIQTFVCRLSGELSKEQWEQLIDMAKKAAQVNGPRLDSIERSDREEAITSWMDAHEISEGWRLAPTFAAARLDKPALESLLASHLERRAVPDALCWLDARLTAKSLLAMIEESTRRISELVSAVKAYSFMDRAPWQEIDVHTGIESTLTILGHKLKNVVVSRQFDLGLPRICAYGSELNQVWTNLIDNAIYATEGKGRIDICTRRDGNHLVVEIANNGRGIPPEVQPRIFEPFFTTKGGAGTGLGLVISYRIVVDRHHGQITFQSRPGETRFEVRLPIDSGGLKKAQ